jgi:hypothetical protein
MRAKRTEANLSNVRSETSDIFVVLLALKKRDVAVMNSLPRRMSGGKTERRGYNKMKKNT